MGFDPAGVDEGRRFSIRAHLRSHRATGERPQDRYALRTDLPYARTRFSVANAPSDQRVYEPRPPLLDEDEPFGTLMEQCALIQKKANTAWRPDP